MVSKIFETECFFNLFLEVLAIRTIKIRIGENNWDMKTTGKVRKDCYFLNTRSLCFVFIKKLFNHSGVFSNVLLDFYSLDDK